MARSPSWFIYFVVGRHHIMARALVSFGVFVISLLIMGLVCTGAWDGFVNGKLYYCTDGGTMDFIFFGDWVHGPESVSQVVPRPMEQPDEIKTGWSITGLWCLWSAFVFASVLVSSLFAWLFWRATSPKKQPAPDAGTGIGLQLGSRRPGAG